jgi:hypothetical protein
MGAGGSLAPMATLYRATLTPSKIDLLRAWVPRQPWLGGADVSTLEAVGAYRFDDPDGQVGMETQLLATADERVLQVPVTYRDSPLAGAESFLIATAQHSVLGERWVYDACGDPAYVLALATAILRGGTQAELEFMTDAGPERLPATTLVSGSGSPDTAIPPIGTVSCSNEGTTTAITTGHLDLTLFRTVVPNPEKGPSGAASRLVGTWPRHDSPALLALARIS